MASVSLPSRAPAPREPGQPSSAAPTTSIPATSVPLTVAEISHDFRMANGRLSRRLRQENSDSEVTGGQFSALVSLSDHGPLTLGELSDLERVTPPSMNRTVNALVGAGLVSRQGAADDGRKVVLALTDAGCTVVRETRKRRDAWVAQRFLTLTPEQQQTLADATSIMKGLAES
jgi:DNA-binding MarR family transcriptional regulator